MTTQIVPIVGQFQSISCRKNIKVVEQKYLNMFYYLVSPKSGFRHTENNIYGHNNQ